MTSSKTKWLVSPVDGSAPYEVEAESYSFDSTSGRHLFENGTGDKAELVANLLNVSVRKL